MLDGEGATVEPGAAPPDDDGLRRLSERAVRHGAPVRAAIESMSGARFVHDRLELAGWQVEIADPQKVKSAASWRNSCAGSQTPTDRRGPAHAKQTVDQLSLLDAPALMHSFAYWARPN